MFRDFNDLHKNFIQNIVNREIDKLPYSFPCVVKEYDGVYLKVETLLKDDDKQEIDNVAILHSYYLHLPIKQGDIGLCLNCSYLFNEILENNTINDNNKSVGANGLFYVPLLSKQDKHNDIESTTLLSQDRQSYLNLKEKEITLTNGDVDIHVRGKDIEINNGDVTIKINGSDVKLGGATLKFDKAISLKGSSGSLNEAFNQVFNAMDLIAAGMTGAGTNPSAYKGGSNAIKKLINQIVE